MTVRLYVLHALAPLHAGTGQGQGLIDLPVARERATGHPIVPGSSVKGVLRAASRDTFDSGSESEDCRTWRLFGPDTENASEYASTVRVSDARILLLPVQSDRGTFAWVTCPFVLDRLRRDAAEVTGVGLPRKALPALSEGECLLGDMGTLDAGGVAVIGGLQLKVKEVIGQLAGGVAGLVFPSDAPHLQSWNTMLTRRLCVVDDDTFTWLAENNTELRARIRLNPETRTVERGGLWYEEALPAESVLAGLVQVVGDRDEAPWQALEDLSSGLLQFGGNASTGQGAARLRLHGGA